MVGPCTCLAHALNVQRSNDTRHTSRLALLNTALAS
jgi:hypothetical protein